MVRLIAAVLVAAGLLLASVPAALAADPTFGRPPPRPTFGAVHRVPPAGDGGRTDRRRRAAPHLRRCARADRHRGRPADARVDDVLTETFSLDEDGFVSPNTPVTARWRLYPAATPDEPVTGPEVSILYADDRFDWKTEAGDIVRVHWYEGSDAFGARALRIAEDAVGVVQHAAGRHGDRADRLLRLRERGRVLRRARAGHARERRRPGQRRDPDPVRAHHARRDRRRLGADGHPARADPPRLRYGGRRTRTTSRRAGSTKGSPNTRAGDTTRATGPRSSRPPGRASSSRSTVSPASSRRRSSGSTSPMPRARRR